MKTKTLTEAKRSRVIASVKASMEIEGLSPSAAAQTIGKQYLEGKISNLEALSKIKANHASKFGH